MDKRPVVITAERPDAPRRKRQKTFVRIAFEWALRELMRIRLAVWLLIIMGVTMIIGSIFPQGYEAETYIESWGETRYAIFSKLGLLNLFHTKYFLLLGIILLLNLLVCSIVRLGGRRSVTVTQTDAPEGSRLIAMGGDADSALSRAVRALTDRGYYVSRVSGGMLSARRGPWPEGVSLLYHIAMAIAILGFILSALHSFEGDVTLYPGEPVVVKTQSVDTGWEKFRLGLAAWNVIGWHPFEAALPDTATWKRENVTLTLNEFRTQWEFYDEKYYPKDWISDVWVEVMGHGPTVIWPSRIVEVNRPLRAGGLTFYQMAYEQAFDVVVWKDGEEAERVRANAYVPFALESIEGMFFPGTLRVGVLFQKYRPAEPVVPHIPLKWQPPTPPEGAAADAGVAVADTGVAVADTGVAVADTGVAVADTGVAVADTTAAPPPPPPERIDLGNLSAEEPLEVEGYKLTLENPHEGSVLTYRHDPGVPLLYIAITAFIIGLALRTYWPSYRVSLWIEDSPGGAVGKLSFKATGMLGEPEAVEDELVGELGIETKVPKATEGQTPESPPSPTGSTPTGVAPPAAPWKPGTMPLRDALPDDTEEPPSST
ncbi:MAG: cytochrome c biogenesis protein ResB [Candidatus Eisenbacteria bacterium]|nr:cytochrome c biogenesis protein ResB [Candidatus Eisenbacteria bacterium]